MTDYIREEIETDELVDEVARQRERVTVQPDEPQDMPLDEALKVLQKISKEIEALG